MRVIGEYTRGTPMNKMAGMFAISRKKINDIVRRAGCPKRVNGFGRDKKAWVLKLYRSGIPIAVIQKRTGVSASYVSGVAKEAGILRYQVKSKNKENENGYA